jgi:hypothetical protein
MVKGNGMVAHQTEVSCRLAADYSTHPPTYIYLGVALHLLVVQPRPRNASAHAGAGPFQLKRNTVSNMMVCKI